jgi:hypothetical protein
MEEEQQITSQLVFPGMGYELAVERVIERHMREWEIELAEMVEHAHRSIGQLTRFDHIEERVTKEMKDWRPPLWATRS